MCRDLFLKLYRLDESFPTVLEEANKVANELNSEPNFA